MGGLCGSTSQARVAAPQEPRSAPAPPKPAPAPAPSTASAQVAKPSAHPTGDLERRIAAKGSTIPLVHQRAITVAELMAVASYVEQHCVADGWTGLRDGKKAPLTPEVVNLYDINEYILKPLTKDVRGGCSLVELLADKPRPAKVFVSHAWGHPFLKTVEIIKKHMEDREYTPDTAIWICAFAIRQNDPGAEIPSDIKQSPFFLAIKDADMTLIVLGSKRELLTRMWCGLEAHVSMVEGPAIEGKGHFLTDIYTHHEGEVQRLTDGFIRADVEAKGPDRSPAEWGRPYLKAARDAKFPPALVSDAMMFTLSSATTSEPRDAENILRHVLASEGGELAVNSTFRARCFTAVLKTLDNDAGPIDVDFGFKALKTSMLTKLSLGQLPSKHVPKLLVSLPPTLVELLVPGSGLTDADTAQLAEFMRTSSTIKVLRLGFNKITHVGAAALGNALRDNTSLTLLNLGGNKCSDEGTKAIAEGMKHNNTLRILWLDQNEIRDAGAVSLGEAMKVNTSLTELRLGSNAIASTGAQSLCDAIAVHPAICVLWISNNALEAGDKSKLKAVWAKDARRPAAQLIA